MKILQIIPILDPNTLWAGSHRVVYDISKTLAMRGHDVTVCTSDMVNVKTRIKVNSEENLGFKLIRVKNPSILLSSRLDLLITPEFNAFFSKQIKNYDIVHVHEYTTYQNIVVHKFAKKHKIPYILQAHGSLPRIGKPFRRWLYDIIFGYRLLHDASKVIALSKVEAERYRSMGVPEEKIAIIPNGIDLSEYASLPPKGQFKKKFNIPEDKKIVLYLGRIHKTKGIDLLIKAYAYLTKKMNFEGAVLVIAGPDDGYLGEARFMVRTLGISDSVLFTGFISSGDKLGALVDAEVFVTPSFYGFPMTFLEACAVGTPIIATSLGDTLEWIDGKVGYLTEPTHQALAEAIYRIISDDALRRKFSRNCINIVETSFSLEKVVEKLEKVYSEVVERN